ncbi:MAG: Ig-like domain-containing protein, partial [Methanophagales archaeon]|nr:Ig-like domain-containing protein [Methanophagales archaeon]
MTIRSVSRNPADTIVQAADPDDHVFEVTANYVNISGFTVSGTTGYVGGIYLKSVKHCNILKTTATSNRYGICLKSSSNNNIQNNIASSNVLDGIILASSFDNTLINNNCSKNGNGIILDFSSNNTLTNNYMSNNHQNFAILGHSLSNFIQNIDTSNTIEQKPMYYLVNEKDRTIDPHTNAGYVAVVNSRDITVENLILKEKNSEGLLFAYTSNSKIENMNISNSYNGIRLVFSPNNIITNNDVSDNVRGIALYHSSDDNNIHLNNFIDNTKNVYSFESTNIWNSTSKITYTYNSSQYTNYLGNYWDDYTGTDANNDGIWDNPYSINSDNDNYPLVERFENYEIGEDTTPPTVSSISPQNGAFDVAIDTVVTATFSEAMDSSTITTDSFTLAGSAVSGTVTYDSDTYTATFTPDANLDYNHEYTATLSTDITDKAGNPLAEEYRWGFTSQLEPSEQPQLKAPWEGTKKITQGNFGSYSHYNHGTWDNTYAIDVALNYESVLAPASGVVIDVDSDEGGLGGKELAIEHTGPTGKKFVTVYLHLSDIFVKDGEVVSQGQVIANSGATGEVTGPHLHFHMWKPKGSEPEWAYDSHTMPIERLVLKQVGVDSDFREYDARKGDLNDSKVAGKFFKSNNVPIIEYDLNLTIPVYTP